MKSAELLAEAVRNNKLEDYETRWNEEFGQEIRFCLLARNIMENMSADVIHKVFAYVKENAALIEKAGDFENHSTVFWSLVTNPRTYPTIGNVMLDLFTKPRTLMRVLRRK